MIAVERNFSHAEVSGRRFKEDPLKRREHGREKSLVDSTAKKRNRAQRAALSGNLKLFLYRCPFRLLQKRSENSLLELDILYREKKKGATPRRAHARAKTERSSATLGW